MNTNDIDLNSENKGENESQNSNENSNNTPSEQPINEINTETESTDLNETSLNNNEEQEQYSFSNNYLELSKIRSQVDYAKNEIKNFLIGQDQMIDLILIGIFTRGHLLLEGVPGIAKTFTSKLIAKTLKTDFARIQFTPDLMPTDIIGTSIYNSKTLEFDFKKGPIFSNIVLIDEINRAPAKTQAALFEVMEERQITFDGIKYEMDFPFIVIATQNPVEQEGTYNLPEAQLDRFLFKVILDYPDLSEEKQILHRYKNQIESPDLSVIKNIFTPEDIIEINKTVEKVKIENQLLDYIASLIHKTRNHAQVYLGASPRASLWLLKSSKALAILKGRDFVTPDDIQYLAYHVLNHRIILTPEAELEGLTPKDVVNNIIETTEVPR